MNEDDGLRVGRAATGLGLFAAREYKRGERIVEYTGALLTNREADERGGRYLFRIDARRVIDGSARTNIARYLNHSCRPNARAYVERGRIVIYAERKIKTGDEITIDYGREYFDRYLAPRGCKCRACAAASQG